MARQGTWSLLRRRGTPAGGLALLCVVLALPARAATPSPDPPPVAVAPEPPPVTRTQPAQVRRTPVAITPVVRSTPPVAAVTTPAAKPKPAATKPVVQQPKAAAPSKTVQPHDRARVPLAALVAVDEHPERGLLLLAGVALLLVALGGAVVLVAARRQLLLAALALLVVAAPAAHGAPSPVTYTVTGTAGANGWYRSNVTIKWTVVDSGDLVSSTCPLADQIVAEGTVTRQCTTQFTWGTVVSPPSPLVIKIDKTAPTGLSASLARAPDSDGWFNHPVSASFSGQDTVSGMAGCSGSTYSGVDTASAALSGTCTDVAGNVTAASVAIKYDATAPTVTPAADRPPDARGWYRKPLNVSFAGTDLTSGIASCTTPVRYAGPDLAKAAVVGSCRDQAGNAAEVGYSFPYDATAPKLARIKAELGKGVARIGWDRAADVVSVEIMRSPGINGAKSTKVYEGKGASFVDKTVRAGIRYRYELSVADIAGNVSRKAVTAVASQPAALYGPAAGAVVRKPPLLRWKKVAGATFYNVQLYRNGRKVLSTWPGTAKLRLQRTWTYSGKRYQLEPGNYTWYVWGARGTRAKPVYGKVLGSSTFVVKR